MKAWEKNIREVVPYIPGEQPKVKDIVKLNTNECPYPPAPGVEKALKELDISKLRLYPDTNATPLVNEIANYYEVKPEQVFVGVGSDDVIGMAFLTFFNSDKPVFFPDITYSFYDVWADLFKIPYKTLSLDDNFEIIPEDYYEENGGVIFPNPNAPTAVELSLDKIEDIIQHNQDCIVIVDEAYIDFGGHTALSFIHKYENVLVVRTLSKSRAAAGLRIGYAMGNESLISALNAVKNSYNSYTMNLPTIVAGTAAMKDKKYFEEIVGKVIKTREETREKLSELGFTCTDSKANFLFAKHCTIPAKEIFEYLKTKGIYVRYFSKPRIDNYLRISIGTDEEMNKLYKALEEKILNNK